MMNVRTLAAMVLLGQPTFIRDETDNVLAARLQLSFGC